MWGSGEIKICVYIESGGHTMHTWGIHQLQPTCSFIYTLIVIMSNNQARSQWRCRGTRAPLDLLAPTEFPPPPTEEILATGLPIL
jgi:hypothetical protein